MAKILFNNSNGQQMVTEIFQGGGISSDCQVLWDERKHGALPEIELGKMEAYDELEDVTDLEGNFMFAPALDPMGNITLDKEGDVIYSDEKLQHLVRKLRILPDIIPAHLEAINKNNQDKINAEARYYLAQTDWYVIRELDCGIACPPDIKAARADARSKII